MTRFRGVTVLTCVLVTGGVAPAQTSRTVSTGADVAQDGAMAAADRNAEARRAPLARIEADREGTISELIGMWAPREGADQLEVALRRASARELLQVSRARSYDEVERILLGADVGAPFGDYVQNSLGDTNQDYVYTPVTPCRIFDTRNVGGAIPAGGTREFYVWGVSLDTLQGGEPTCPAPRGEPRGVHLNVTVVPVGAQGNIRVYPANVGTPNASAVNFKLGTNIANALTVPTYYSLSEREIEIFAGAGSAHVLADVLGYYYQVDPNDVVTRTDLCDAVPLARLPGTTECFPTCRFVNGLFWCYNNDACGQACNDVCSALGLTPVANDTTWFQAQDTVGECQAISQAFGLGTTVSFSDWTYACLEDTPGTHLVGGGILPTLYCSSLSGCPANHRTGMDQLGTPCGASSRRSICPCE